MSNWQDVVVGADILVEATRLLEPEPGPFGSLRAHVNAGKPSAETLHAEMGQIVAGLKPGRESDLETILFWHRGLSLSDIALGTAMIARAERLGIGQRLRFA